MQPKEAARLKWAVCFPVSLSRSGAEVLTQSLAAWLPPVLPLAWVVSNNLGSRLLFLNCCQASPETVLQVSLEAPLGISCQAGC